MHRVEGAGSAGMPGRIKVQGMRKQPSDGHKASEGRDQADGTGGPGAEGQRVRALRAMRAELTDRVAESPEIVVTAAMVPELEDNKREVCSQARREVTSAILMAAEEQGMQVEVFDGGAPGSVVDRVAEAHQWAVDARWVREAEAAAVLERWRDLAIQI